jgi:hypothetical protein
MQHFGVGSRLVYFGFVGMGGSNPPLLRSSPSRQRTRIGLIRLDQAVLPGHSLDFQLLTIFWTGLDWTIPHTPDKGRVLHRPMD